MGSVWWCAGRRNAARLSTQFGGTFFGVTTQTNVSNAQQQQQQKKTNKQTNNKQKKRNNFFFYPNPKSTQKHNKNTAKMGNLLRLPSARELDRASESALLSSNDIMGTEPRRGGVGRQIALLLFRCWGQLLRSRGRRPAPPTLRRDPIHRSPWPGTTSTATTALASPGEGSGPVSQ